MKPLSHVKLGTVIKILLHLQSIWHVFTKNLVETLLLLIEVLAGADRMMLVPTLYTSCKIRKFLSKFNHAQKLN